MPTLEETKLACAKAAHEVNRVYCQALGDPSQVPWEQAPEWQQTSALKGVDGVLAGDGPGKSHESWLAEKTAAGWKHGPVKSFETKEHPCMVPFDQLPLGQRMKDILFVTTVRRMAMALGFKLPDVDWGGQVEATLDALYGAANLKVTTRSA